VVTTHTGHGEDADVMGVYASPDAARAALEAQKNMLVYVIGGPDDPGDSAEYYLAKPEGTLVGVPADARKYPHVFAVAVPMKVQG
jgi:hypothetical protein